MREGHGQAGQLTYIKQHLSELVHEHNLGTIAMEKPPLMMLFVWAHHDGRLGDTLEQNDQALENAFVGTQRAFFEDKSKADAALVTQAHKMGVDVIAFDSRVSAKEVFAAADKMERYGDYDTYQPFSTMSSEERKLYIYQEAERLYHEYPEYRQRLDKIEEAAKVIGKNAPTDSVSAALASRLANPKKNMLGIIGDGHVSGEVNDAPESQGIFDDALAKQGWKVSDIKLGSKADIEEQINIRTGIDSYLLGGALWCKSYDQLDAIYLTDKDEKITFPRNVSLKDRLNYTLHDALEGMSKDDLSCTNSPPVEEVYSPQQLNPVFPPAVEQSIKEVRQSLRDSAEASNAVPSSASQQQKAPAPGR